MTLGAAALAALLAAAEPAQLNWQADFCVVLSELAEPVSNLNAEHPAAVEMQAGMLDPQISAPALFSLWVRELPIEVFWWRKDERVARALIASLYLVIARERTAWVPSFEQHSSRYAGAEAVHRSEEVRFVQEHRSAIARLLAQAYKGQAIRGGRRDQYEAVAAENEGRPLPCDRQDGPETTR